MRLRCLILLALFCPSAFLAAQPEPYSIAQIYVGYSYLSNSFNGVPGSRQPLNGWDAAIAFPGWRHLHFKLDYSMYRGNNLGEPQHAFFILGGGQYEATFHRERFYAQALVGEGGLNGSWYKSDTAAYMGGNSGSTASLAELLGGGIDTPIGLHTAIRVEGGVQHSNFDPNQPSTQRSVPFHLPGIPTYFGRFSAGIVWLPRWGAVERSSPTPAGRAPVESELAFEGLNSFGHFHIFADSWWSYLSSGGIEYDRHSWGNFIGAHLDYVAEFLPVVILRQPSKTTIWGGPLSRSLATIPGVGISPIGMRMLWNDGGIVEPYYTVKAGIIVYTQKAFSQYAAYENFSLQQVVGMQFKFTGRWSFRAGFEVFHQSNGFVVPSNPGLDEMTYSAGLSCRLGGSANAQ